MYSLEWLLESQRYVPCLMEELWKFLPAEWGTYPFAYSQTCIPNWVSATSQDLSSGQADSSLKNWPTRSLGLIQCSGFLWGPMKDLVCMPPLPRDIYKLPPYFRCSCICFLRRAWTSVTRWTTELKFATWQTGHISSLLKLPHELPQFLYQARYIS